MASKFTNFFSDIMNYTESIQTSTANGVSTSYVSRGTIKCAFYEGRSAEAFIGDKIKATVDAIAIHNPLDITFTIADQDKCSLSGGRSFIVVHSDNVGLQNGVLVVALKEDRDAS